MEVGLVAPGQVVLSAPGLACDCSSKRRRPAPQPPPERPRAIFPSFPRSARGRGLPRGIWAGHGQGILDMPLPHCKETTYVRSSPARVAFRR